MKKEVVSVQSVDRALKIIDILQKNPKGLGVTELSYRMDLSKSTVHRMLMSLLKSGFVKRNDSEEYMLGLKLISLGQTVSENLNIRNITSPYLLRLSKSLEEAAHLVVKDNNEIVYIDKIESPATIRMFSKVGKRAPMHCTGVGKAILAFLPEQEMLEVIDNAGLQRFTENTIVKKQEMLSHLEVIKKEGFSLDYEEHELGIRCAAAPIFNHNSEVVAGISVAGPIMRVNNKKLQLIAKEVMEVSKEISMLLGYKYI